MSILKKTIPTSLMTSLKAYFSNLLTANLPAYLNAYDIASGAQTTFSNNNYKALNCTLVEGLSRDGLSLVLNTIKNGGDAADFMVQFVISFTGTNNNNISLAIFNNNSLVASSEQSVTIDGNGHAENVYVQCVTNIKHGQDVQVYVKNVNDTNAITLNSINITVTKK